MILYEKGQSDMRVVLEAVQGCVTRAAFEEFREQVVTRTEFEEFRGQVGQRFDQVDLQFKEMRGQMALVIGELRGLRRDVAGHAQASELRALDQRVTALERRAGP